MRIFNAFINSVFLYNSELWTLTKKLENEIDVFQRHLLRRILKIKLKDQVKNTKIYQLTETTPWSRKIKERRLKWLGHLLRLPTETPARKALEECLRPSKRPQGRPKTTWISQVNEDLKPRKLTIETLPPPNCMKIGCAGVKKYDS